MNKVREVARYLNDPWYGGSDVGAPDNYSDSLYSYESFCGACEQNLANFYSHLGMRFCTFCGEELERGDEIEGLRKPGEPWATHPLILKHHAREVARTRERELAEQARNMCASCGFTEWPIFQSMKTCSKKHADWNPKPLGKHFHRICPSCGDDRVSFLLEDGKAIMAYNAELPQSGSLADREVL